MEVSHCDTRHRNLCRAVKLMGIAVADAVVFLAAKQFRLMMHTYPKQSMRSWLPRLLLMGLLAGIFSLGPGQAQTPPSAPAHDPGHGVLYAATGAELTRYDVDAEGASLVKRDSIRLPANVQYAWPHPSRKYLYVAWSGGEIGRAHV